MDPSCKNGSQFWLLHSSESRLVSRCQPLLRIALEAKIFKIILFMFFVFAALGCDSDDDDTIVSPAVPEPPNPRKVDKPSDEKQPWLNNTDNNQPDSIVENPETDPIDDAPDEVPQDDPNLVGGLAIGRLPVAERHILFVSDGDKDGICIMNADGTNRRRLFEPHEYPVLSSDMQMIAYTQGQAGRQIFIRSVDGNRVFQLTGENMQTAMHPDWSHDSAKLAFSNEWNMFVMGADGLNVA